MRAPNPENLLLGRGKLYFDRFDANGDPTGEEELGNCTEVQTSTEDEKREKFSSQVRESVKLKSVTTQRTVNVNISLDEHAMFNMALVTMGEEGTLTQAQGQVTGEMLTENVVQGRWYPTEFRSIANVTIAGAVEGTDFEVDSISGRVKPLVGGNIADDSTLTVEYEHNNLELNTVNGGSASVIEGRLRFIGDPASGPKLEVLFHRCSITPGGGLGLITDDYGAQALVMEVLQHVDHTDELWKVIDITNETAYEPT
jgi:hypothetical protein